GHGTPTVILFGRNRSPVGETVRAVMGIKGEPSTPENPAQGEVWCAIVAQVDQPGSEGEFVSVADSPREPFCQHPWTLGGGGATELKAMIDETCDIRLATCTSAIGFSVIVAEGEAFTRLRGSELRVRMPEPRRDLVFGEEVRDWSIHAQAVALFPYDTEINLYESDPILRWLWPYRTTLWSRPTFDKRTYKEAGRSFVEYHQIPKER